MIGGALDKLGTYLRHAGAPTREYVLFGSAVLFLHGLRPAGTVGDLDVFVSRRVWGNLLALPSVDVLTPRADDPPLLEIPGITPIHVFYDWTARDDWLDVRECFRSAEPVRSWQCCSLQWLLDVKRGAVAVNGHEKHARDIPIIERHLGVAA